MVWTTEFGFVVPGPASNRMAKRVSASVERALHTDADSPLVQRIPARHLTAGPKAVDEFMDARYMTLPTRGGKATATAVAFVRDFGGLTKDGENGNRKLYYVGIPPSTSRKSTVGWGGRGPRTLKGTRKNWGTHDAPEGWLATATQRWGADASRAEACACANPEDKLECSCSMALQHPMVHVGKPKSASHFLTLGDSRAAATGSTRWYRTVDGMKWVNTTHVRTSTRAPLHLSMSPSGGRVPDGSGEYSVVDMACGTMVVATPAASEAVRLVTGMQEPHALGLHTATTVAFPSSATQTGVDGALRALSTAKAGSVAVASHPDADPSVAASGLPLRMRLLGSKVSAWSLDPVGDATLHAFPACEGVFLVTRPSGLFLLKLGTSASDARVKKVSTGGLAALSSASAVRMHDYAATVMLEKGSAACVTLRDLTGTGMEHVSCTTVDVPEAVEGVAYHPSEKAVCLSIRDAASPSVGVIVDRSA